MVLTSVKLALEEWSKNNIFKQPDNVIFFSSSDYSYINVITGERYSTISQVRTEYEGKDYSIQISAEMQKFKAIIKKVPGIDAIMISIIGGDFSDRYTAPRSYFEYCRFFMLSDKSVLEVVDANKSHIISSISAKEKLIGVLRDVCPFSTFDSEDALFSDGIFKNFSELFGPVAIINENTIIPFSGMNLSGFFDFLCCEEYPAVKIPVAKKVSKYISMENLDDVPFDPEKNSHIALTQRLNSGVVVVRFLLNEANKDDLAKEIMRFYIDKNAVTACRINNSGCWVPAETKKLNCEKRWRFVHFKSDIVKGSIFEKILYYFDEIDENDKWPVFLGSICYPWFRKLLNSEFRSVMIHALRNYAKNTPKDAVLNVVGYINACGKRPNSILKMNNYQIKCLGDYFSGTYYNDMELSLIIYVKWILNSPYNITCEVNDGIAYPSIHSLRQNISYIDNQTFSFIVDRLNFVIRHAKNEDTVKRFAASLYFLHSSFSAESMKKRADELILFLDENIVVSEIENICSDNYLPIKDALSLYLMYLYELLTLRLSDSFVHRLVFYDEPFYMKMADVLKKLDTKTGYPTFSSLAEKYNLVTSILAAMDGESVGYNVYHKRLFGCEHNFYDNDNNSNYYTEYYFGNEVNFETCPDSLYAVFVPQRTADIAVEGLALNNFAKQKITHVGDRKTKIFFVRRKDDISTPYYTLEVSNWGALMRVAGANNYFPVGNKSLLEFIENWCHINKITYSFPLYH